MSAVITCRATLFSPRRGLGITHSQKSVFLALRGFFTALQLETLSAFLCFSGGDGASLSHLSQVVADFFCCSACDVKVRTVSLSTEHVRKT